MYNETPPSSHRQHTFDQYQYGQHVSVIFDITIGRLSYTLIMLCQLCFSTYMSLRAMTIRKYIEQRPRGFD